MDPTIEKILKLPNPQKYALMFVVIAALAGSFFYFLYLPKMKELAGLRSQQADLNKQILESKKIADNLPKYRKDYEQLKADLEKALTELPNQAEIPSLLTNITSRGKEAGLDFLVFRPRPEEPKDFYSSVPVEIMVSGSYYNVANFFIAVGNLPRIVNISNVVVADLKNVSGRMLMKVNCLATTFRFLEKKEIKDEKKRKNNKPILAALLVAMLLFAACKKNEQPPSSPPPQPVTTAKPPVQKPVSSAKISGTAATSLDFSKKKDPFKPAIEPVAPAAPAEKAKPVAERKTGDLLPIQSYEVSKFTISGIVVGLKENTALIIDPTGRGYVVKEGMLIGNSDGRISRISASSIDVVETFRDSKGHNRKRTIKLLLKKK